jgi:hypothetical protein
LSTELQEVASVLSVPRSSRVEEGHVWWGVVVVLWVVEVLLVLAPSSAWVVVRLWVVLVGSVVWSLVTWFVV